MDKLTAFEKSLIDKGLEEVIEIFKKDNDRLISEGKIPMITHKFITQTVESIKDKLGLNNYI
jgi:hypothetical protein